MLLTHLFNTTYCNADLFLNDELSELYVPNVTNNNSIVKNPITSKSTTVSMVTIIKDIPSYLKIQTTDTNKSLGKFSVKQYNGYLVNLVQFNTVTAYINTHLSKRNVKNLFAKQNRLHQNHQITYKVFTGDIEKDTYNAIFKVFYVLLKERFKEKKIYNRYLPYWDELQNDCFEKTRSKKASLHVIFDDDKPISITLNYHLNNITFSHIQAYDIAYSQYNLGDISMYKNLEWCFLNGKTIFDVSVGKTDYKTKWCNETYKLEYHIFYKKNRVLPFLLAYATKLELITKQFLRDKNLIGSKWSMDKIKYKLGK